MMAGLIHGSERATRLLIASSVATALLSISACGTAERTPQRTGDEQTPVTSAFQAHLNELTRQTTNERAEPIDAAPPPHLAQLSPPADWDAPTAATPYEGAIAEASRAAQERFNPITADDPNELARNAAMRLYVGARNALIAGRPQDAVTDLESAARLDPGAARIWEVLGEAHSASGNRMAATIAMRRAAEAGSERARTWLAIAIEAQRRGQHDDVIFFTSKSLALTGPRRDTAAWVLGHVTQGQSLHARGFLAAGNHALQQGLETPLDRGASGRRLRAELAAIERARPTLWTTIGDAETRLGRYDDADRAYDMADRLNSEEATDVISRRMYVALRAGRPATAGRLMLDAISRRDRRVAESDVGRAAFLREHAPAIAEQVAAALADGSPTDASSSELARRVRARAAASEPETARTLLADGLRVHPGDEGLIRDLIDTSATIPVGTLLETIGQLGTALPLHTDLLAERLLNAGIDHESLEDACVGLDAPALHARLLAGMDRRRDGLDRLGPLSDNASLDVLLAAGEIGAAVGDWSTVAQTTDLLEAMESTESTVALARVAGAAQHHAGVERALDALDEHVPSLDARSMIRIAALANSIGDIDRADAWLGHAAERDPGLEQIYIAIIELHGSNGPAPDSELFRSALTALRERVPDSRAITLLRVREAMSAGNIGLAQRELLATTETHPSDRGAADLLVALWTQIAPNAGDDTINKALEWIEGRGEQPGWHTWGIGAKARMLMASGDPAGAEALLDQAIAARPTLTLQKQRVGLLAANGRGEEAGRELIALLEAAPSAIENTVDLTGAHLALGQLDQARETLDARLPVGSVLTPAQTNRLATSLLRSQAMLPQDRQHELLTLADQIAGISGRVPPSLLNARVVLALSVGSAEQVIDAARDAANAGVIQPIRDRLLREPVTEDDTVDAATRAQSDLTYLAAIQFAQRGDDDSAVRLYERTIELAPRFAMAHNNLGYTLVEQGLRIQDAADHLEKAYEVQPDDPSIIDSLGWLRYRQGMLDDTGDRRGAVWLLRKASRTDDGRTNETILDHLGDALWRAGSPEPATEHWKRAIKSIDASLPVARQTNDEATRRSLNERRDQILAKITATNTGKQPKVAPLFPDVEVPEIGQPSVGAEADAAP